MLSRWPGWLAAAVVTLVAWVPVVLDVTDAGLRGWWDEHALTSDTLAGLLVLRSASAPPLQNLVAGTQSAVRGDGPSWPPIDLQSHQTRNPQAFTRGSANQPMIAKDFILT